jgi:hypothetical protein
MIEAGRSKIILELRVFLRSVRRYLENKASLLFCPHEVVEPILFPLWKKWTPFAATEKTISSSRDFSKSAGARAVILAFPAKA